VWGEKREKHQEVSKLAEGNAGRNSHRRRLCVG
jgi:hypothetical protein